MAIPATPLKFYGQQANGEVLLSWALASGATSYSVQRSTDGVTYTVLASPATNSYLDTAVTIGTQYFYKVASTNASGTSPYTAAQSLVPTPTGEMSLGEIRMRAQQRADRLNSDFVDMPEWNFFINQAMFELYDLLITAYDDYFAAAPLIITADGTNASYALPNGTNNGGAAPFYKLLGVDLGVSSGPNGWVTMDKFNFIDRNKFAYPTLLINPYGGLNINYRLMGSNIQFMPLPGGGQNFQLWYIPRLAQLLADNDITTTGVSGWLQYVIIRAAKYALDKEESDTSKLDSELAFLNKRIEESSQNRDAGQPSTISDSNGAGGMNWINGNGFRGGI